MVVVKSEKDLFHFKNIIKEVGVLSRIEPGRKGEFK
jgi:hypothetical protein